MKLIGATFCTAMLCAAGLAAQTSETKTKTKVEVKEGKEVAVVGCILPNLAGGYTLAELSGDKRYVLVTKEDLSKHVGHRVEITGKATDRGDAKVKVETKARTEMEDGKDKEAKTKTTAKGDMPEMPLLGVKSVKMISTSCQ